MRLLFDADTDVLRITLRVALTDSASFIADLMVAALKTIVTSI